METKILVIDDDMDICNLLQKYLTRKGYDTQTVLSAKSAFEELKINKFDIVFCDYRLRDKDGKYVLKEIKNNYPATQVIIMTAYSDIKMAVHLIKAGAFDYLSKPLVPEELLNVIEKADAHHRQKQQQRQKHLQPDVKTGSSIEAPKDRFFKGSSAVMKKLFRQVDIVAPTDYSIILHGESGSGKEVIAKNIHQQSNRSSGPFIALDCGTLSKELANSELFGHVKGSFTGALNDKKGHFELAHGGTLFLDEVSNLTYDIQAALLRVIQERKMKRIGGTKEIKFDVRIIVASNEDLRKAYLQKEFREDLFHRLNEFSIKIPALRERKEDIPDFAAFFLKLTNQETGKQIEGFEQEVMEKFMEYPWPGNVRELRNVIRRAVLLTPYGKIKKSSLSSELLHVGLLSFASSQGEEPVRPTNSLSQKRRNLKDVSLEVEYQTIIEVLESVNFNKTKAAKILNIDRKTLYNKLKEYER